MNIVLGTVIIFILLVHPIAFYLSFSFGKYPSEAARPKFTLIEGLLATATISLLLHSFVALFIQKEIHFDILLKLITGDIKEIEHKYNNDILKYL